MKRNILLAGSEGVIGKQLQAHFSAMPDVALSCVDLALGQDLTQEAEVEAVMKRYQPHYLINAFALNDHVDPSKKNPSLMDISLDALRTYCEINLVALFGCCRAFVKHSPHAKGIVNFSSLYGIQSPKHFLYETGEKHIGYTMTKYGVVGLTQHLATYWAPHVRVNCLVPGGMQHTQDPGFIARYSSQTPMGRMMAPGELNGIIALLCSEESSYITGAAIPVDGGWSAW